ncbi:MAG: CotH kinase family protein, partial [Microthrixaceae bacterium]
MRSNLVAGAIELTWTATIDGQAHGYQLQVMPPGGGWADVPNTGNAAVFTDVVPRTTYLFRVRSRVASGTTPKEFSPIVSTVYVEPQLPIVRIDTDGFAPVLDRDSYVHGAMTIDPNGSDVAAYSGTLGVKGRGNSTWDAPKKPYRLKLDTKSPIMGIASSKDWVLLANYLDKSQLRTWTAAEISEGTDLAWTPTFRHVEVIFNGQYLGVYQLTESIKPASTRVDIEEMEPTDNTGTAVTGGYLM